MSMKELVLSENLDNKKLFPSFKQFKKDLKNIIFNSEKLKNFLSLDNIHKIMFGLNRFFFYNELKILKKDKYWKTHWNKIIKEQKIGNPVPFFLYPDSSGNRIHDTYNLMKLSKIKNQIYYNNTVLEFGGGYGNFCNLFLNLYSIKNYIIYDLLEVNLIQYYYLKMLGYQVILNPKFLSKKKSIYLFNNINELKKFINKINLNKTIFLSNWGLSETPLFLKNEFEKIIKKSNLRFFAFLEKFKNINNLQYFNKLLKNNNPYFEYHKRANEKHYYFYSSKE